MTIMATLIQSICNTVDSLHIKYKKGAGDPGRLEARDAWKRLQLRRVRDADCDEQNQTPVVEKSKVQAGAWCGDS